jgi:hypothetical protein
LRYSLFESEDAEGFKLLDRLIVWSRTEDLWSAPHPRLAVAHLGHPETLLILGFLAAVVHAYPAGTANQLPLLRHATVIRDGLVLDLLMTVFAFLEARGPSPLPSA